MRRKLKPMKLERDQVCGTTHIDLLIERDAGNNFLVLMGSPTFAIRNYRKLRRLCNKAIAELIMTPEIIDELAEKVRVDYHATRRS